MLSPYYARLRSEIERFGGTVEKFIGDAVMAVFGAPVAHEDDPERAVRAALAVRDAVQELNEANPASTCTCASRVNTGEAVVALDAAPVRRARAWSPATSSTRPRACRRPRRWTASSSARRPTARPSATIEYRDCEPVEAKGKAEPIPVWEALGARARYGVDVAQRGGAALVGRGRGARLAPRTALGARRAGADAAARHPRRRSGHRQEPPGLGARAGGGRRSGADRLLAPGAVAPVRRRRRLLGPGGDGQGAGGHPRDRLRGGRRDEARRDRRRISSPTPRRRAGSRAHLRPPRRAACGGGRPAATDATRPSRPGGASSRHSPSGGRPCSSSRTCTGPTTTCSTSSTTSSTG